MRTFLALPLLALLAAGCHDDIPHNAGQQRPSVTDLDRRDRGLQSTDVVQASDEVVQSMLSLPEFNGPTRKTVVVTNIENKTTNPNFNYDIFLQRLKTNVAQQGRDRIFIVENKQRIQNLRIDEIEGNPAIVASGDGGPQSVQPEFALYGVVSNLPNRGTDYYFFEFNVTNLKTREQIPLRPFEVRVGR